MLEVPNLCALPDTRSRLKGKLYSIYAHTSKQSLQCNMLQHVQLLMQSQEQLLSQCHPFEVSQVCQLQRDSYVVSLSTLIKCRCKY